MSQYSFESQAEADYRLQWPEGNAPEIDEISYTWQTVYEQLQEMTTENMLQDIQEKIGIKILSYRCNNCDRLYTVEWDCFQCTRDMSYSCREIVEHGSISLSRVLSALGDEYPCSYQVDMWYIDILDEKLSKIPRKLLTEDWSDAMLNDQSDETIQSIYKILCK